MGKSVLPERPRKPVAVETGAPIGTARYMRHGIWIVLIVVLACIVGFSGLGPWADEQRPNPDTPDDRDVESITALIADLGAATKEIDEAIAAMPEIPRPADLDRMQELNTKLRALTARIREAAPKLKGELGVRFLQAQERYDEATTRIAAKLDEMQRKIEEMK